MPLSVSGILVGSGMASIHGKSDLFVFALALLTTLGLQIISNLANDYGDGIKGTDNDERIGPKRAMQSGALSASELKSGILISVLITLVFMGFLLYAAFDGYPEYFLLFTALGAIAVWAAIRYTVGDSAYGYKGLGDLFVFCFFGLLAVLGTLFLFTKDLMAADVLPAMTIGFLSTAVLNLNNMRDITSDKKAGKNTLAVKLGIENAKVYHYLLLLLSLICLTAFLLIHGEQWYQFTCLLAYVPLALHAIKVRGIHSPEMFDPELKKVALSTFGLAVFFYLGFNIFL
ncbi:1,4-dihydroxy-2-naphthoate prenyltransferase [Muriicola jejuensis]|nr:1,4-dihydroxy-2-naphthoate prenyltransferase [Muriicola jejuensis]